MATTEEEVVSLRANLGQASDRILQANIQFEMEKKALTDAIAELRDQMQGSLPAQSAHGADSQQPSKPHPKKG